MDFGCPVRVIICQQTEIREWEKVDNNPTINRMLGGRKSRHNNLPTKK
jgi:hypothetical protein